MSEHLYLYTATGVRVQTRSIITQLVFEHSLRVRLAADAAGDKSKKTGQGEHDKKDEKKTKNLLGRINNSVTSDASSILDGTDWLNLGRFLFTYGIVFFSMCCFAVLLVPLQVSVIMVLLYGILGLR